MIEVQTVRRGRQNAIVTCDCCGVVTAEIPAKSNSINGSIRIPGKDNHVEEGPIYKRLSLMGWSMRGKTVICPTCIAARRSANQETSESNKERAEMIRETATPKIITGASEIPPREPDRATLRAIRTLLDEVYDVASGRYRGSESDETVAEAIGRGCMWGWVSRERIAAYGEGCDNEDMTQAEARIEVISTDITEAMKRIADLKHMMESEIAKITSITESCMGEVNKLRGTLTRNRNVRVAK